MAEKKEEFTILNLDESIGGRGGTLLPKTMGGVPIRVVGGIIDDPRVRSDDDELRLITDTTEEGIDYIVLGDMGECSVARAKAIAEPMRKRTCVVWRDYRPGYEKLYDGLGITAFMSRDHVLRHIARYIEDHPPG